MHFLGVIIALILIAVFWRQLLGLAVVVVVVVGGILTLDWVWQALKLPPL